MTKSDRLVSARWRCALSRVATDGRASELLVKSQVVCFVRQLHLAAASGWNPLEPPLEAHSNTCGWSSSFETPRCGICSRQEKIRSFICQPACLSVSLSGAGSSSGASRLVGGSPIEGIYWPVFGGRRESPRGRLAGFVALLCRRRRQSRAKSLRSS